MRQLLYWQIFLTAFGALSIGAFQDHGHAASYSMGCAIVVANLVLHFFIWTYLVAKKKLIAFAITVIVFKYAIFGAIIYQILKVPWVSPIYFCVGIGSFMISALIVALLRKDYVV